jgi:prophage regulatory protein
MRILPYSELKSRGITYSREQIRRLIKQAKFPMPISLSDHRIAWVESELDAWLETKAALRSQRKAA